mgnify:CR=1
VKDLAIQKISLPYFVFGIEINPPYGRRGAREDGRSKTLAHLLHSYLFCERNTFEHPFVEFLARPL